jgi:sensor histidine kinase YesM
MNNFLALLNESVDSVGIEIIGMASFIVVLFILYYWLNEKLYQITRSLYLRRSIIAISGLIIFSICFFISRKGAPEEVSKYFLEDLLIIIFSVLLCYHVYYLFETSLNKKNEWWVSVFKFFLLLVMVWLCCANPILFQVLVKRNLTYGWVIGEGNLLAKDVFFHSVNRDLVVYAEFALITSSINAVYAYIMKLRELRKKEKELKALKLKEQLTKAQLDALHAKVNPHFLYNSLNSIAGLALTDGQKTQQMAVSLSKFFRYSINHKEDNLVTVGEELEMAETYLKIEQIRFEERLNFEVIKGPGTEGIKIPRFMLQPLVENSVKHGMKGVDRNLFIRIWAQREGKNLSLSVEDDGQPFGDDLKPGYGLKSIYDKLDILFPEKYEVALYNEPVKQVRILIEI